MKKLKDMEPSFFDKFSEEELEFMDAWEELYYSPEFQEDIRRVSLELILEEVTTGELRGKKIQDVSCKEYLQNCKYRKW